MSAEFTDTGTAGKSARISGSEIDKPDLPGAGFYSFVEMS
jgi:hypothetical protein